MTELELELAALHRLHVTPAAVQAAAPRVLDRLTEMLVLADELLAEFHTEDANGLLWIEPYLLRVYGELDSAVNRLAH